MINLAPPYETTPKIAIAEYYFDENMGAQVCNSILLKNREVGWEFKQLENKLLKPFWTAIKIDN